MSRKYSEDVRNEVYELFLAGYGTKAVAERLNIPRETVKTWRSSYLHDCYWQHHPEGEHDFLLRPSYEAKIAALNLIQQGLSPAQVARRFQCSVVSVRKWIHAAKEEKII